MPAKTKKSQLRILMEDHMLIIKMNKSFSVDFSFNCVWLFSHYVVNLPSSPPCAVVIHRI